MFETPFYHSTLRKTVVAFGNLFSNVKIARENNAGVVTQTIHVPIAYGPKDKAIVRTDSDPNLDQHTYTTVPRLSFEILGYQYDSSRKLNKLNKISCQTSDGTRSVMFTPAPYSVDVALYLLTKTTEDAFQVLEQILPLFTPEYTLSIKTVPEFNIIDNVPVTLNSVSVEDDYDGSFEKRRFITHTFMFNLKVNFYNEVKTQGIIKEVIVNVTENPSATYTAIGTLPGEPIIEEWVE